MEQSNRGWRNSIHNINKRGVYRPEEDNRMNFIFALLILVFGASIACAEPMRGDVISRALDPRKVHALDAGLEPYLYVYEEDIRIKNRGMMMGYYVNYAYRPADGNFFNNTIANAYMIEGRIALGKLDYKGSGVMENRKNLNYEIRGLVGKDYLLSEHSLVTPYLGFGYRTLLDEGNGRLTSTNFYGYDRHSQYLYVPVGFYAKIPSGIFTTSYNAEYDIFISGLQVSDLSSGKRFNGFDNPNIHSSQRKGVGLRGSIKLSYAGKWADFYLEPFVRYWRIAESKLTAATVDGSHGNFYEPRNSTVEIGFKIGLQF